MKHIAYPKIPQIRTVISNIKRQITFKGLDEAGDPIYDNSAPLPKLKFKGTVKLHGTNAGVSYNSEDGIWFQSRENIITLEKDNVGFAFFGESKRDIFQKMFDEICKKESIDSKVYTISIYGEWAGGNIQKSIGISKLGKALYIFGVKISKPQDDTHVSYWVDSSYLKSEDSKIYNIADFTTYEIEVDLNIPSASTNKFIELTTEVEEECPVAKYFGIDKGLGEGIVWSIEYEGSTYRFKVKGEKHSVSNVKTMASVDVEKLDSIMEFVEYSVTDNRVAQAIEKIYGEGDLVNEKLGDYIRWMINDIASEEMDTMVENNLEPKEVNKYLSTTARTKYFQLQAAQK